MTEQPTIPTVDETVAASAAAYMIADDGLTYLRRAVENATPEQRAEMVRVARETVAERDALREWLRAFPAARKVLCPAVTWETAADRYDVTKRARKIVAAAAAKAGVTEEALLEAMAEHDLTVQGGINLHGDDPRTTMWGTTFYAFRWRVRDGLEYATQEKKREEAARLEAEMAAKGLERCERCWGKGGADHWPGFTCYDCDGRGWLPLGEQKRHHQH